MRCDLCISHWLREIRLFIWRYCYETAAFAALFLSLFKINCSHDSGTSKNRTVQSAARGMVSNIFDNGQFLKVLPDFSTTFAQSSWKAKTYVLLAVDCWYFYMNYEASFDIWHFPLWSSVTFYEYLPPNFKSSSSPSCRQILITDLELSGIPGPVLCEFLSRNFQKEAIMCTDLKLPSLACEGSLSARAASVAVVRRLVP